jgi:hypothetical protein
MSTDIDTKLIMDAQQGGYDRTTDIFTKLFESEAMVNMVDPSLLTSSIFGFLQQTLNRSEQDKKLIVLPNTGLFKESNLNEILSRTLKDAKSLVEGNVLLNGAIDNAIKFLSNQSKNLNPETEL